MEPSEDRGGVRGGRPPHGLVDVDPGVDPDRRPSVRRVDLGHDGAATGPNRARHRDAGRERGLLERDVGGRVCLGTRREDLLDRPGADQRLEAPDPAELATRGGDRRAQWSAEAERMPRWRPHRVAGAAARTWEQRACSKRTGSPTRRRLESGLDEGYARLDQLLEEL